MPEHERISDRSRLAGVLLGVGAYLSWGFVVIYFKQVAHIPALELIAHRVLWSLPFLVLLMALTGGWARFKSMLSDRRVLAWLPLSTILLGANWLLFMWVVIVGQVLQASLAYFITPLMMVLLGVVLLGERLRRMQAVGLCLAGAGVVLLVLAGGIFPWAAGLIAVTWSLYSLVRKVQHSPAIEGLAVEVALLTPLALGWLIWKGFIPEGSPYSPARDWLVLSASGVVTAAPLVMFGASLRRIQLKTVGFLQYIAPTFQFLLAVLVYHEPFNVWSGVAFGLIWIALAFYTADTLSKPELVVARSPREGFVPIPVAPGRNVATDADFASPIPQAMAERRAEVSDAPENDAAELALADRVTPAEHPS